MAYILPVYNEAEGIEAFHADLVEVAACRPDLDVEFVYIDDGSRDDWLFDCCFCGRPMHESRWSPSHATTATR